VIHKANVESKAKIIKERKNATLDCEQSLFLENLGEERKSKRAGSTVLATRELRSAVKRAFDRLSECSTESSL